MNVLPSKTTYDQRPPTGFTLLELMLALALTSVVLVAISMAIDLHLRLLDSRRAGVERAQLARAVLQRIAADLRGTVSARQTDFSAISTMASAALSGGAEGLGDSAALQGLADELAGGEVPSADEVDDAAASMLGLGQEGESAANQDIADSTDPPPVPGLYGNQYELQMDVSRLPRIDEFEQMIDASNVNQTIRDIPSDLKTVAYYVRDQNNLPTGMTTDPFGRQVAPRTGLVRRVLDRAVNLQADQSANLQGLQNLDDVLAPEVVAVEFEYFDGTEWTTEWDSDELGGLPVAVRITIMLGDPSLLDGMQDLTQSISSGTSLLSGSTTGVQGMQDIYSLTVRLPTAEPIDMSEENLDEGLEAVGL